jgi:hypothetical protein
MFLLLAAADTALAQFIETSADRVRSPLQVDLKQIGSITPRSTDEIECSLITVGCETLDRDLAVWDNYRAYLPPLGVKKIRLQAGWAKTERTRGVYDWTWLDEIIDYAVQHGMEPWLEASYGNPIYEGGGAPGLLHSMMTSEEGYAAWDRWVEALATRYSDRVKEWEVWNEPDHPLQDNPPEVVARLNIRTAEIIKRIQPEARIAGLAFASHSDTVYLDRFLKVISDAGKLDLFEWISYHAYTWRPEDVYSENRVQALQAVIDRYSPTLKLRQGENGAPSTFIPSFALAQYYWTEYTQAKYNMRRVLGDLGRDIETAVFTIIDIFYRGAGDGGVLNTKGLIEADTSMAAIRPKVAYYAIQNLAAIFDCDVLPIADFRHSITSDRSTTVFGFRDGKTGTQLVALWVDEIMPTNSFETAPVTLTIENVRFEQPVWIDLMTGRIYEIPENRWSRAGNRYTFTVPAYDSPVLIAEKRLVME